MFNEFWQLNILYVITTPMKIKISSTRKLSWAFSLSISHDLSSFLISIIQDWFCLFWDIMKMGSYYIHIYIFSAQYNTYEIIHDFGYIQLSSVQLLSHVQLFATPWNAARQASLSITNSRSSPKPTYIELVMPSSHLILCHPLFLHPVPASIRVSSNESTLRMRWPKYWSFSFSNSPSKETPGLISLRLDWLDLLAEDLKSPLQHHGSKASILLHLAFFTVRLSQPYMTTGKTIALTRRTFVGKIMSLLFNMEYYFTIKKEWCTNTNFNMDRPWKHYVKGKKPITKYSIYRKCVETGKFTETK